MELWQFVQKIWIVWIDGVEKLAQMFSPAGEDALLVLDKHVAPFLDLTGWKE